VVGAYNRELMNAPLPIRQVIIHRLVIPMRKSFKHARSERQNAEPLVVELLLADGTKGFGETHPRDYVTGETLDSVVKDIQDVFVPLLVEMHPDNFGQAMEAADGLPCLDKHGRAVTAARAAIELAVLDAYGKAFNRSLDSLAGYLGETWMGLPGSADVARFCGVLSGEGAASIKGSLRKMRLFGLRNFKLKVGDESDEERLALVVKTLSRGLNRGKYTLRLDANAGWSFEQAVQRLTSWEALPIVCVEQPLAKDAIDDCARLAQKTNLPLMADESLVTFADGEALIARQAVSWFNIRISKNGGLIPSMRLAMLARQHGIDCMLGCMVGETSILSAAGRRFLQLVPDVRFAEGSFGRFLLSDDLVSRALRFSYGGKWRLAGGSGLGVTVQPAALSRLAQVPPHCIPL
jgi:muconate cycloisomerase